MDIHTPQPTSLETTQPQPTPPLQHDSFRSNYGLDDGYDYLSEPNENLLCPICRNPFVDPVMCESTDHIFCRICLIKSLEVSPTCPIDRLPLALSMVSPAPKIVNKLVDELLVSCPFKLKLECSFVCQRDLMTAHVRVHKSQLEHQDVHSPLLPQQQGSEQHLLPKSSSELRFKWHVGRVTVAKDSEGQTNSHGVDRINSESSNSTVPCPTDLTEERLNEPELAHCPYARFGCLFSGTPEVIKHEHLSIPTNQSETPDHSHCPFSSFQEILTLFQHLEKRNHELSEQLSQSLVKQDDLVSALNSLKASFRQLWLQGSGLGAASTAPVQTSPDCMCTEHKNLTTATATRTQPTNSNRLIRTCQTPRFNYNPSSGNRLTPLDHHFPSPALPGRCCDYYSPPSSSPLATKDKMRVWTFARKGEVVAPTNHDVLSDFPAANPSNRDPNINSERRPNLPKLLTGPIFDTNKLDN